VIAVVVAALILGQRSSRASYATRLQDDAVWKAVQLILESFAFLLIGLQLPTVVGELAGIRASTLAIASVAVLATVIVVRLVWVYAFAYLPRMLSASIREREPLKPTPAEVFIVAWAGMRGVVSLAAAFARLDEIVDDPRAGARAHDAAEVLRGWNERRQRAAWERLGRGADEIGESPASAFKRLRLEMLAAERAAFIAERDAGAISDEVLRAALHGLDLEEATLNRD
jgi:hypothetical protein